MHTTVRKVAMRAMIRFSIKKKLKRGGRSG